jgi:hypothetical protein
MLYFRRVPDFVKVGSINSFRGIFEFILSKLLSERRE